MLNDVRLHLFEKFEINGFQNHLDHSVMVQNVSDQTIVLAINSTKKMNQSKLQQSTFMLYPAATIILTITTAWIISTFSYNGNQLL